MNQPNHENLDQTFIARQRERLLELRAQLIADGDAAGADEDTLQMAAGDEPRDAVDDSNRLEQQGNDEARLTHDLNRIAAIDRALEKIRQHTYGLSDGNGEAIGRAHLEAVPEAIFTVDELNAKARQR
ncbi:TraR/DksA family transcriptional regulator [Frateuria hangzhouensis]|uniref:TraR/DksA family transcriptional regulator n=1 Tax=Frateuria hangzhouensis TaxID=2995589 RepID=UPI0022608C9F|nr:TraR/DksA family transcriptional regulator [Frateuria sp. STR12]MCX7513089.1 TraR/DksA family transcriptional regulator [Frateuria sp. STR12]